MLGGHFYKRNKNAIRMAAGTLLSDFVLAVTALLCQRTKNTQQSTTQRGGQTEFG